MRRAGYDTIADLHALHAAADRLHDAQVAVTHPARIAGRAGHLVGAFVVAAVGADFEREMRVLTQIWSCASWLTSSFCCSIRRSRGPYKIAIFILYRLSVIGGR